MMFGDHLVLVPVPAHWGYKRHHPQARRPPACWDGFLGPGIKLGGRRLAGGCGRVAGGGDSIGAEDGGTAAHNTGRRTGGGGGVIAIEVGALAKRKGCGRRPGSGVMD